MATVKDTEYPKKRKKAWIIVLAVCIPVLVLFILDQLVFSTNDADNRNPSKQAEMLALTLEWGRLAPLPDSKTELNISTAGNSFTRRFSASFLLPEEDLTNWVADSPGLQDAQVEEIGDKVKKYVIDAGGGAGYAQVIIDYNEGRVETYVCWS